ncbi:aromatic ring-hydroxylating dioxygenase subunit alpha [Halioxenophilus sp. WMMB6]|uniref:aromatic ring-hydroxylating dioxygenase subunit alpha n=1 Tax=Halioxenophilus sp. WMMB6 TaxID=3073815 RepID=UPI00295F0DB3|nr:aromatic ring-hydroxylating dioxygenase subunit alpha [Halioxenophilus sp. WMMB6]
MTNTIPVSDLCPVVFNDWHIVGQSDCLAEGGSLTVSLLETELLIWRHQGQLAVVLDQCPHRGAKLSLGQVVDGLVHCPYHGWQFDQQGNCLLRPAQPTITPSARSALKSFAVCERYGVIWVCLGDAERPVPEFVGLDDDYELVITGPYRVNTSAPRAIENFIDMAHFSFIHQGSLGSSGNSEIADYTVQTEAETLVASDCRARQPKAAAHLKDEVEIDYIYRILRPCTAMLSKQPLGQADKPTDLIMLSLAPEAEELVNAWMISALSYAKGKPQAEYAEFQEKIFLEDRAVLESQSPKKLPLNTTSEVSQAADKFSVAYRHWLKSSGIRYGVLN